MTTIMKRTKKGIVPVQMGWTKEHSELVAARIAYSRLSDRQKKELR